MGSNESASTTFSEMSSVMGDAEHSAHRAKLRLMKKKIADRDKQIAERDAQLKGKAQEVEAKERVIAESDATVQELKHRLSAVENGDVDPVCDLVIHFLLYCYCTNVFILYILPLNLHFDVLMFATDLFLPCVADAVSKPVPIIGFV